MLMTTYASHHDALVLLTMCEEPGPWRKDELLREFSEPIEAADALDRLRERGLVMRMDDGLLVTTATGRYANKVAEERA